MPDNAADDAPSIARRMKEIACQEGRHEYSDTGYCKHCSAKRKEES